MGDGRAPVPGAGLGHVGESVLRVEDSRHLNGRGTYVADLPFGGALEVAFVRSTVPFGKLIGVSVPELPKGCAVVTGADLASWVKPIVATSTNPNLQLSAQHCLASGHVRYVGEPVALVAAATRAQAEDLAEQVELDTEELPPVPDARSAVQPDASRLHADWTSNVFLESRRSAGSIEAARSAADRVVRRSFRMARASACPMETRGLLVHPARDNRPLTLWASTQRPHLLRTFIGQHIDGLREQEFRVVAPDVGGGFGPKGNLFPEDIAVVAAAILLDRPLRWIEDRWEHLAAGYQAREHEYDVTAYVTNAGEFVGLEVDLLVDGGAYSTVPSTAAIDASMAASVLPGPYRHTNYVVRARTAATNKPPLAPYRGVGRPGGTFAMERIIHEVAEELGLSPNEVRRRNMIGSDEMPYTTVSGLKYDSGDYPAALDLAEAEIEKRASERSPAPPGTRRGIGYGSFVEQTGHGADEWYRRGMIYVYGHEVARATMGPYGGVTLYLGTASQGQGHETTMAQIAATVLGLAYTDVAVRYGDTEQSPFGMGTFGSRSIVMGGGAVHAACTRLAERIKLIAASWLECPPSALTLADGYARGGDREIPVADIAYAAHLDPRKLPAGTDAGLEFVAHFKNEIDTGAFSYGTHAAHVEVDLATGYVRVLDYVVAEDCGTVVNPMIVDGQVQGGVAQGIGQALLEHCSYDEDAQPTAVAFTDYLLPGAPEVPTVVMKHLAIPSPHTTLGMKGVGEGGVIGVPAAIANAIREALREWDVPVNDVPVDPRTLWAAISAAPARTEAAA